MTTLADRLIENVDLALKTLVPGSVSSARSNPAAGTAQPELSEADRHHAAGLMRINHTGEVCAQALYQGQSLTARLPDVRESMELAAGEEIDHLAWCEERLTELDSRPSLLNPLWYGLSFGLGAVAGLAGDKWSLGFVAETEKQVGTHLDEHLGSLPENDVRSREILEQMQVDEAKHEHMAREAGGRELPEPVRAAMGIMATVMKKSTYRI